MPDYKKDNRILFISDIGAAPPYRGNRIRMRALLKEIRELGYKIHFAGIQFSDTEKKSTIPYVDKWIKNFTIPKKNLLNRFTNGLGKSRKNNNIAKGSVNHSIIDANFHQSWGHEILKIQESEKYHTIFIPYIYNSGFFELFDDTRLKIMDTHDIFNQRNEKLRSHGIMETWFSVSKEEEKFGLERANRIIAIQKNDQKYLADLTQNKIPVFTVRHFVENNFLAMNSSLISSKTIGYLASENPINVHGLKWFLSNVLPDLKKLYPDIQMLIGGSICSRLDERQDYILLGEQEDPGEFFKKCFCTINPMQVGTGLKIKTIESLSYGRPVVSTDTGLEGLEEFIDHGIIVANSGSEFITAISSLFESGSDIVDQIERCAKLIEEMNEQSRSSLKMLLK